MRLTLFLTLFCFVCYIQLGQACHSALHGAVERKKRQADLNDVNVANTEGLRNYFTNCMRDMVGDIWDWQSVIDTTVLDTFWYDLSDENVCSEQQGQDTAECWRARLDFYLKNSSFLFPPSSDCIFQYERDISNGIIVYESFQFGAGTPFGNQELCVEEPEEPFYPNSPTVRQYTACNQGKVSFPPNRPALDFPSVFQFVEGHTICSAELRDCNGNNVETLSSVEPGVARWPYRLEAITKDSSPLSLAIPECNEMFFPASSDWSIWSDCSASCGGGGTRSRTRQCSEPGCETSQSENCGEEICPRCQISKFSRRVCAGFSVSRETCELRGCCYDQSICYQSMDEDAERPVVTDFRPTVGPGPGTTFGGGQPGFPGTSVTLQCNSRNLVRRCGRGLMDRTSCSRFLCCWNEQLNRCYQPTFTIPEIRKDCPPGFSNPPACRDINDCASNPCENGGTCIDRIQGFECQCPPGYTGDNCNNNGVESCPPPPTTDTATIIETPILTSYPIESIVSYTCFIVGPGITLVGSETNTCVSPGIWINSAPICTTPMEITCGPPPLPDGGGILGVLQATYEPGSTVFYSCDPPTNVLGSETNQCIAVDAAGIWINDPPICCDDCSIVGDCDPPPLPANGGLSDSAGPPPYFFFDEVTYVCDLPSVIVSGSMTNLCIGDTLTGWSNDAPVCGQITCDPPPLPVNGGIEGTTIPSAFSVGDEVTYTCDDPLAIVSGDLTNMCQNVDGFGVWINSAPTCFILPVDCGSPPTDPTVEIVENLQVGYFFPDQVTYQCTDVTQEIISGPTTNQCQDNGIWLSLSPPTCGRIMCGIPPLPDFGGISGVLQGSYAVGEMVTYVCDANAVLSGTEENDCTRTDGGTWFNEPPTCFLTSCGPPPTRIDESIQFFPSQATYALDDMVDYFCTISDFMMNGPSQNTCTMLGWSEAIPPTCEISRR
ncbi:unnamed protein product [Clavelina lepadiformis]|uniref:Uncharacterized protein n=1 Tax=Clavelina lepadiformis TaxID=159417 RepID=A0ABP0GAC2_CLALP